MTFVRKSNELTTKKDLDLIDWNRLPDYLFEGCKSGVPERLREYLLQLKETGAGRAACASSVGLAYNTIMSQRARVADFEKWEFLAEQVNIAMVDRALFKSAINEESKHQVPAARLWKQSRHGWVEPKTIIENLETVNIDFSSWDDADQKVAMKFVKLVEKYSKAEPNDQP